MGLEDDIHRQKISAVETVLTDLHSGFDVFKKISYVLFSLFLALASWYASTIQGLQTDRTHNADKIEANEKAFLEYKAINASMHTACVTDIARISGRLETLTLDVASLKTRFNLHEREDDKRLGPLHPIP